MQQFYLHKPAPGRPAAIHGHRGARGRRPENTLEAVQFAIETGADAVEVDLCVTSDDVVVIHHDLALSPLLARIDQQTWIDTPLAVRDLTLQQVQQYDVGQINPETMYAERFPHQISMDGICTPTLDAFIQHVLQHADEHFVFNIELKSDSNSPKLTPDIDHYTDLVLTHIERYGIAERTFIQSFDWRLARLVREKQPAILTGLLTNLQPDDGPRNPVSGDPVAWCDFLDLGDFADSIPAMIAATGAPVWSSHHLDLTPQLIEQAHTAGLLVYTWTVNEVSDMRKMLAWQVDAITTDYPDTLCDLIRAENLVLCPA